MKCFAFLREKSWICSKIFAFSFGSLFRFRGFLWWRSGFFVSRVIRAWMTVGLAFFKECAIFALFHLLFTSFLIFKSSRISALFNFFIFIIEQNGIQHDCEILNAHLGNSPLCCVECFNRAVSRRIHVFDEVGF